LTAPSLRCCSGQSPSSAAQPSVRAAFARHQHRPPRRHDDGPDEHFRPRPQRDAGYQSLRPDSDRARQQRSGKPGRSPGTRLDPTALRGQRPGGVQALTRSRSTFLSNLPRLVFGRTGPPRPCALRELNPAGWQGLGGQARSAPFC